MPNEWRESGSGSPGRRELIVIGAPNAELRITPSRAMSLSGVPLGALESVAASHDVTIRPLFGASEERVLAMGPSDAAHNRESASLAPVMARFYQVDAPDEQLDELAARLRDSPAVEAAYVKPAADLAMLAPERMAEKLNDMAPTGPDAPPMTPDFTSRQGYLNAAPGGVDARWAWTQPGGRGAGVRVIDCEWGWRFTHEDLRQNQGGVVAGTADPVPNSRSTNHGTAVLGEISGDVNGMGVTGISPDAVISASAFSVPTSEAIKAAADRLGQGDIILLEIHRGGPNYPGGDTQFGFIAVEWWPDDYLAIRYAVSRGIVVVEAAGNGFQNLDDPIYDTPEPGFPPWWRNPFRRNELDSGAVIVGAGAPPSGNWGPDRSRLDFSNFGACVDAQGWGREVTTTGYGDLQTGPTVDVWYTSNFSGTSSASPIVVGALACVQGVLRANGRAPLSPARARELLRATGSPQQDGPERPASQRIGNRPDLRRLIPAALQGEAWPGVPFRDQARDQVRGQARDQVRERVPASVRSSTYQFSGALDPGQTFRWFNHSWPVEWHVVWHIEPNVTAGSGGGPHLGWEVEIERSTAKLVTYWITVRNLRNERVTFDAFTTVLDDLAAASGGAASPSSPSPEDGDPMARDAGAARYR